MLEKKEEEFFLSKDKRNKHDYIINNIHPHQNRLNKERYPLSHSELIKLNLTLFESYDTSIGRQESLSDEAKIKQLKARRNKISVVREQTGSCILCRQ